ARHACARASRRFQAFGGHERKERLQCHHGGEQQDRKDRPKFQQWPAPGGVAVPPAGRQEREPAVVGPCVSGVVCTHRVGSKGSTSGTTTASPVMSHGPETPGRNTGTAMVARANPV